MNDRLDDPKRGGGRGGRTRLSDAIGCQTAYTAQVLRGGAHFSPEQAEGINEFFAHSEEEGDYFLLLIQFDRAGNPALRRRFEKQISAAQEERKILKNRLGVSQTLTEQDQVRYYSAWHYSAIHALVSVPGFQSAAALAKRLRIHPKKIADALEFLQLSGLLTKNETSGQIGVGTARIHLGADSPLISKHHINWRLQAIRSIDQQDPKDLHYSSAVSLSIKDSETVREILIETVSRIKALVKESKEETTRAISLDFFEF